MEREAKLWGERCILRMSSQSALSFLKIRAGHRCSWHHHKSKYNLFFVLSGCIGIKTEDGETILQAGEVFTVPPGIKHEFRAYEDSSCIEEMYVEYDEGDIYRDNSGGKFTINEDG